MALPLTFAELQLRIRESHRGKTSTSSPSQGAVPPPQDRGHLSGPQAGRNSSGVGLSLSLALDSQFTDKALTNQLALLLLERSDSLYQVPGYEASVHR